MQAGLYLSSTRGFSTPESRNCYERAEPLCHSLDRPMLLYSALMGQWRYSYITDKLSAALPVAQRVYSLATEQNNSAIMIGACQALVSTLYWGEFETARQYAVAGLRYGARAASSITRKISMLPLSFVYAIRRSVSGMRERSPLVSRRWMKRSH
jgi:hypothetical protein